MEVLGAQPNRLRHEDVAERIAIVGARPGGRMKLAATVPATTQNAMKNQPLV